MSMKEFNKNSMRQNYSRKVYPTKLLNFGALSNPFLISPVFSFG